MAKLVSCSEKDPSSEIHSQIKAIGGMKKVGPVWMAWRKTQAEAIAAIESGEETYYVNIEVSTPNLIVAVNEGIKYLKAFVDLEAPTTLLNLPDCQKT